MTCAHAGAVEIAKGDERYEQRLHVKRRRVPDEQDGQYDDESQRGGAAVGRDPHAAFFFRGKCVVQLRLRRAGRFRGRSRCAQHSQFLRFPGFVTLAPNAVLKERAGLLWQASGRPGQNLAELDQLSLRCIGSAGMQCQPQHIDRGLIG